jgi:hypothetical protein
MAEGRIGNTVEAFDESTRQKRPALWVARARLLADRLPAAQRRLGLPDNIML